MPRYPFLSDDWIEAARRIREDYRGKGVIAHQVRMNQVITDVPFGTGTVHAHLDTTVGEVQIELGHLDDPDVTVTTDYLTARAIFVDGDPQATMQAFMSGRIKVEGDMAKLLVAQQQPPTPEAVEAAVRIKDITE